MKRSTVVLFSTGIQKLRSRSKSFKKSYNSATLPWVVRYRYWFVLFVQYCTGTGDRNNNSFTTRISRSRDLESPESREITTIMLEIQQIMKGSFSSFMHKEIFEQPESIVNTMRGRTFFCTKKYILIIFTVLGGCFSCPSRCPSILNNSSAG